MTQSTIQFLRKHKTVPDHAFNQMNFIGWMAALIRMIYIIGFSTHHYARPIIFINLLPAIACTAMTIMPFLRARRTTVFLFFLIFPALLFSIGWLTPDRGILIYFIPYFVYPFFFLNNLKKIMICSFVSSFFFVGSILTIFATTSAIPKQYDQPLETLSIIGALVLLFATLFSNKVQVGQFEKNIRDQKKTLESLNLDLAMEKESLRRSNLTKDKLFSIISHDLRISLQSMFLLHFGHEDPQDSLQYISNNLPLLKEELAFTNELLGNLMKWSQMQLDKDSLSAEDVDLLDLSRQVIKSLDHRARAKEVKVDISAAFNPSLHIDKGLLEIVLRNLISNAIKFSHQGGSVQVIGCQLKDSYVLQVSDNGTGISEKNLDRIMGRELFTSPGTAREKGSGMGLMICRELIERCGGVLSFESIEGEGTVAAITLPITSAKKAKTELPPAQGAIIERDRTEPPSLHLSKEKPIFYLRAEP